MSLHLTPEILRAAYELLRTTLPFRRWKLPHADEIEFHVNYMKDQGDYLKTDKGHRIRLSARQHSRLDHVLETMAHEMCHLRQRQFTTREKMHGATYRRFAAQVCESHEFDMARF